MAISGLDIDAVRRLSSQLSLKSQEINTIIQNLGSQLGSTQWEGPDAARFRNEWDTKLTTSLRQVATALGEASQTAGQNATAQEQTSNS